MTDQIDSPNVKLLRQQLADGRVSRREFVRYAALLGLAAPLASKLAGFSPVASAHAAGLPQGGTLRMGTQVKDIKNPAT